MIHILNILSTLELIYQDIIFFQSLMTLYTSAYLYFDNYTYETRLNKVKLFNLLLNNPINEVMFDCFVVERDFTGIYVCVYCVKINRR